MLGGLFSHKATHPNHDHLSHALHSVLGLTLAPPIDEVMTILDQMSPRELVNFDNLHSVAGMQELFRVKGLTAVLEDHGQTVRLSPRQIETPVEPAPRPVLTFGQDRGASRIIKPLDPAGTAGSKLGAPASAPAASLGGDSPGFENLERLERLFPELADLFVRHGKLHTGDKAVLRDIHPVDSSIEARVAALERWKGEMTRRMRGLGVPRGSQQLMLSTGDAEAKQTAEEELARRYEAIVQWTAKLIKAFEHTGIKFHNKPMWLPH
jgi:hypothetical protein